MSQGLSLEMFQQARAFLRFVLKGTEEELQLGSRHDCEKQVKHIVQGQKDDAQAQEEWHHIGSKQQHSQWSNWGEKVQVLTQRPLLAR